MFVKRVQLVNYGPVDNLDITFPFESDTPIPVLLVGENGSGKTILLSHIVNGLTSAKDVVFSETPEVKIGKVYKIRSSSYIRSRGEYYFGKVDFEDGLFMSEIRSRGPKRGYETVPNELAQPDELDAWNKMDPEKSDYFDTNLSLSNKGQIDALIANRCVLYFPHNRFEEPAWLNEENLNAKAQYMDLKHLQDHTERKVINYSPLHENQNWLFDLLYDRAVLERNTQNISVPLSESGGSVPLPVFMGYSGTATTTYRVALEIVRKAMCNPNIRFGVGRRNNRVVSVMSEVGSPATQLVPNIFQLSSGESSVLNLFLSILRDFDLCDAPFSGAEDIRGIVVIDEIDLHLHAVHQYEVLPELIQMFPNVQFVVTTHSPLIVLGMQRVLGADGFALYRLPEGNRISPEEFTEFGDAYQAFTATRRFNDDVQAIIEKSQRPIVFVEGTTDQRYIERAATLFGKEAVLDRVDMRDGGGSGKLAKMWRDSVLPLTESLPHQVLLLFDCDTNRQAERKGMLFQRSIPVRGDSPVKKGIENLFGRSTLEVARQHKPAFFITEEEHGATDEYGQPITIPEKWEVIKREKGNLCDWLCGNGSQEDFEGFHVVFDLIEESLDLSPPTLTASEGEIAL